MLNKRWRARAALLVAFTMIAALLFTPATGLVRADIDAGFLGSSPGRFNSIKVMDIDDDGNMEMVFGNYEGHLTIIEARGDSYFEEWQSDSLGTRLWGIEVGDIDADDVNEIVAGTGEGIIHIFDAKTHQKEWESGTLVRDAHGIALGDVDGDGDSDIVVGTGYKTDTPWGTVYVFDGKTHALVGTMGPFDSRMRGIAIADIDGDAVNEIIFGSGVALGETAGEGYIRIYSYDNGNFTQEWISDDLNGDINGLIVHDVDGDGKLEMITGNGYRYTPGYIHIFRYKGAGGVGSPPIYEQVWVSEDIGPKVYGLAVGDVDDDGIVEIVAGNQPGYMWIFDGSSHELEWKSDLLGTDILGVAVF
ncbi:MAG: VCBS repeat-containing protein, partial [Thermoplasmata archaeon]|nr:VCBS repeat-containing protein [Thermoplasmata archaeon]